MTYVIEGYVINNKLDQDQRNRLTHDPSFVTTNDRYYGGPINETMQVLDPVSGTVVDRHSGFNRMFICKPIMHYFKMYDEVENKNKRLKLE